jgi:hypothetical protein
MYDFYKVAVRMMMYPVLYMLIWTIPTAIRIYQGTSGHSTPLGINCVDKVGPDSLSNVTLISKTDVWDRQACIVIQGLADSIIYGKYFSPYDTGTMLLMTIGLNERTWNEWMKWIFPRRSRINS